MRKRTIEEYLEIILILQNEKGQATTGEIANLMNISSPSVSEMLAKLDDEKLIIYTPYKGVTLSSQGLKIANNIIKKHQIISDFLQMIGVEKETAEIDACNIEHHISDKSMEKLIKFLEYIKDAKFSNRCIEHYFKYLDLDIDEKKTIN
ncbi:MAG: metal-dependent transcriptional regulator [Candidatus Helarchaeota archaeon]